MTQHSRRSATSAATRRLLIVALTVPALALGAAASCARNDTLKAEMAAAEGRQDVEGSFIQSPLMRAIRAGQESTMTSLLGKGASATAQDDQWSPLILAAFLGNPAIVDALVAHGASVNGANGRGMTSLMQAASRGHAAIAEALLAKGATVDAVDAGGHSALMFAANNGHADVVTLLLAKGASPAMRNRAGATAAALAAGNGYGEIVALLKTPGSAEILIGHPAAPAAASSDDAQLYTDAAATAWRYIEKYYEPSTGLIDATEGYAFTTVWDLGSGLGALYAGHELKLIDSPAYDLRMRRALKTLAELPLYDGAAFNKVYSTRTAEMVGADQRPSAKGYGFSVTDVGRLLMWLKIIAVNQPQYQDQAAAIVARLKMDRLVKDGYLQGETVDAQGVPQRYQEGRMGYEQYAARGFAAWGVRAERALPWGENGVPVTVMGQSLLADLRGGDRITSDPFILIGTEMGWDAETRPLAEHFLAAEEARYQKTGRVTMVGEDAMTEPPYFFYYYSALANGKDFALDVQDPKGAVESPRWVSAKAAWAWHALLPGAYTAVAIRRVAAARMPNGWASGVYESTGKSTAAMNINTAGLILASAVVHARGGPLVRLPER